MEFFKSSIHLGEVIVQLIAFVIVFLVLRKFAWKSILGLLEERRLRIQHDLEAVERAKREIEGIKAGYSASKALVEEEARVRIQEAIQEGKRIAKELQENARMESRAILDKAKEDLIIEVAKARIALRNEIADLTLSATEQILDEKLDASKDKKLVLQFMDHLESKK